MIHESIKEYAEVQCCECGTIFLIPHFLNENLKKTMRVFYCPNGHGQSYTKSTADILREQLEAQKLATATAKSIADRLRSKIPAKIRNKLTF